MRMIRSGAMALSAVVMAGAAVPSTAAVIVVGFSGKVSAAANNAYDDPELPSAEFFTIGQAFSGSFSYDTGQPVQYYNGFASFDLQTFNVSIGGVDFSQRFIPRQIGRSSDGGVQVSAGGASQGGSTSLDLKLGSFFGNYPTAVELDGTSATFSFNDYYPLGGQVSGLARLDVAGAASPVPEPKSWLLMALGFGMVGYAMRRHRVAVGQTRGRSRFVVLRPL